MKDAIQHIFVVQRSEAGVIWSVVSFIMIECSLSVDNYAIRQDLTCIVILSTCLMYQLKRHP